MSVQIITEDHLGQMLERGILNPHLALESTKKAHLALHSGSAVNIPRSRARTTAFTLHNMSAASQGLGFACVKTYSTTRDNNDFWLQLYSIPQGKLCALISAQELGRLRTAAASVLACSLALAHSQKTKSHTAAIIGCGYQAQGLLRALADKNCPIPVHKVLCSSRNKTRCETFSLQMQQKFRLDVQAVSSVAEALASSELVFTCTTSPTPVITNENLNTTKIICALGSNSLTRSELSPTVLQNAREICVDDKTNAAHECGELLSPLEKGQLNWAQISELGQWVAAAESNVATENSYAVFLSQGLAIQDLYLAAEIFARS